MIDKIKKFIALKNKKSFFLSFFGLKESYSQGPEDLLLDIYFKGKKGFYVDVGANHPKVLNNFYLLYKKGWRGINIEPNYYLYKKLLKYRPHDINLNVGVGNGKEMEFYMIDPHVLSTFNKEEAKRYEKLGHKIVSVKKIKTLPLSEIFDRYLNGRSIDVLSVDVEGFEMEVLKTNDWNKYKPLYIILETLEYSIDGTGNKTNKLFDKYLSNYGYEKIADTYINTIYKLT